MPTDLTEGKWVIAVQVRPGAAAAVHHVIVTARAERTPEEQEARRRIDPGFRLDYDILPGREVEWNDMEELAVLKNTGVELLVNWINEAEGRIDGLGCLLLFVIDALPDEQFKTVDESIANNLRALKSDTPPLPPTDEASQAVRTSFIRTLEQAQSILQQARTESRAVDRGSSWAKRKSQFRDAVMTGNALKNLLEFLNKLDTGG